MSGNNSRRQEDRCGVAVRCVLHGPDDQRLDGRVRNISPTGACVEHGGSLRPGDDIALEMGYPIPQPARVVWASEQLAGISFAVEDPRRKSDAGNSGERRMVGLVLTGGALVALTLFGAQAWLIQQAVRSFW
jgi:hypothetical protein